MISGFLWHFVNVGATASNTVADVWSEGWASSAVREHEIE
jgi:hypothetical protein